MRLIYEASSGHDLKVTWQMTLGWSHKSGSNSQLWESDGAGHCNGICVDKTCKIKQLIDIQRIDDNKTFISIDQINIG